MQHLLALTFLAGVAVAENATCDYNTKVGSNRAPICIRPTYKAETEFTLAPLLPETAKFVYAFDNITYDDWDELKSRDKSVTSRAWWIEYDTIKPDFTLSRPYFTSVLTTYINGTGPTGGNNNGCENVLGKECIDKINAAIETLWTSNASGGLNVIQSVSGNKDKLLRDVCPKDLFQEYDTILGRYGTMNELQGSDSYLAIEYNITDKFSIWKTGVNPSGNSSWTYFEEKLASNSLPFFMNKTAVTFVTRQPRPEAAKNQTMDQIQHTMLCTRISQDEIDKLTGGSSNNGGNSDNNGSNGNSGGDNGGAGSVTGIPMVVALVISMAAVLLGGL